MKEHISYQQFVTDAYRGILNRDADEQGFGYLVGALQSGISPRVILAEMINSAEFRRGPESNGVAGGARPQSALPQETLRLQKMWDPERQHSYVLAFSEAHSDYEALFEKLGEPEGNARLLMNLLQGAGTLVDVGANIGTIAVPVAASGSSVIAIEMHPVNCLKLWTAAAANGFQNLQVVQAAAGDHDGMVAFQGDEAWGQVNAGREGIPCICLTLDTVMSQHKGTPSPIVLKVDVEGYEANVFRGATETLRRHRPVVLFESIEVEGDHHQGREAKAVLAGLGYDLYLSRGKVLCPKKPEDVQEGHVTDFLAVPQENRAILAQTGAEIRQFTDDERIDWVKEMALFPGIAHQAHAKGVLLRWERENPDLARRAGMIA